jgi:hypothetical protein
MGIYLPIFLGMTINAYEWREKDYSKSNLAALPCIGGIMSTLD